MQLLRERPAGRPSSDRGAESSASEVTVRVVGDGGGGGGRRRGGLATVVVGALLTALIVVLIVGLGLVSGLLSFGNPFAETTVDRTPPVVLHRLRSLSSFDAARAAFEVNVDIEHDHGIVPGFVAGDRSTLSAVGYVDATVDFRAITAAQAVTSDGGRTATITLPLPRLRPAEIDQRRSHVTNRDRGLLDRVGGLFVDSPTNDRPLYLAAAHKMDRAAAHTALVARAERSTRTMLRSLLSKLGYQHVVVRFGPVPKPGPARPTRT